MKIKNLSFCIFFEEVIDVCILLTREKIKREEDEIEEIVKVIEEVKESFRIMVE